MPLKFRESPPWAFSGSKGTRQRSSAKSANGGKADIGLTGPLRGACQPAVDSVAKRVKIDGLGKQRVGTTCQCFSLGVSVAIGRDHYNRNVRSGCFRLWQKFKTGHARHVDIGQDQDQRSRGNVAHALKGAIS